MKRVILTALLLLVLASSPLITIIHETTVPNESKTTSPPPELPLTDTSINAEKAIAEKARITQHKITPDELEHLKNSIGVYEPDQNYTQLVDGYGTGLRPPTEAEWQEIGATAYLVDSVDYQAGDGAPSAVDQSATPWFPPIGNQGSQGSCVAWSVGYYIKTFQEAQEHGWDLSGASWINGYYGQPTASYQSKIISPAFIYNLCNGGVDKGLTYAEAIQLICSVGACSWEKMPYNLSTYTEWPSEAAWTEAALYRGNSSGIQYMSLSIPTGLDNLKNWIASGHLATISVDSDKYSALTSADMWTLDNYNNLDTDHANTIIGYDDSKNYTEGGTVHYGAFKIANSWGIGGWEKVPDGFYWISYEAMKQRVGFCMFYYDMTNYQPQLLATFRIDHPLRNECDIKIGLGNTTSPIATKSFSQYIDGGSYPFCQNNIVFDITELMNYVPTVLGRSFFLRVYDAGTSAVGNVTKFAVDHEDSPDVPRQTVQSSAVYLNVTLPLGKILINSSLLPSLPGQKTSVGSNVNLFFGNVKWSSTAFYLLVSRDKLYQVSTGDIPYSPTFNIADLNASAIATYTSAGGSWQLGYNWVNGTVPTSIPGGSYFFKASDASATEVTASDTSITVVGTLEVTPTSGPAGTAVTINGYGFLASSSANLTYLNPVTSQWVSIANNTVADAAGHFTYNTVAPDLIKGQPAGDNPALFDAIVFRAQDNGDGAYYNATTPFNEFRRGLAQVGSMIAAGLYGNTTDLTATVQVASGHLLTVAGKWFAPGNVVLRWDGADLDVAVADEYGFFNKTFTVPTTSTGTHVISVLDANVEFVFTVTVLPSPVTSDNYDGLWHTSDFTITLTCADDGNGIGAIYYRINNGPIKNVAVDGQPAITMEGANNILEYWSVDGAGVEELPHKMLTQIKLDKTPPTGFLKINSGASYTGSRVVTLTLTAVDTISGIFQVRFSNDGVWDTEQWESPVSSKSWVLTAGDGMKTVFCQVRDNVGLVSTFSSSIKLDTEKPVAHAQTVFSGLSVTFDAGECTDNEGVVSYIWDFGDGTTGTGKTATHTYTNPGTYNATLTVEDMAGNTATSSIAVIVQADIIPELPSVWPLIIVVLTFLVAVIYRRKCKN